MKVNGQWLTKSYTIGDVGIFPAHQVSPAVQFDRALGFIHLCLEPAIFTRVAFEFVEGERLQLLQQLQTYDPLIQHLGLSLKRELEEGGADSQLYAESVATMLTMHLFRRYADKSLKVPHYTDSLSQLKLREVLTFIHEHLDQALSLSQLAQIVHMSPHYFATCFKQSIGCAPHQYITRCRVERAKQLLRQHHLSVLQIAQQVGFQSPSHFAKLFRQQVGTTPKEYRSNL